MRLARMPGYQMDSLRGHLLIASPRLPDSNFAKTVVLLVEHHEQGALGVILNRPTGVDVETFWKEFMEGDGPASKELLNVGGPCEGQIMCVHCDVSHAESSVIDGVYMASGPDNLSKVIRSDVVPYRIFIGYAGWGPGQLEYELEAGGWMTTKATNEHIFGADLESLWQGLIKEQGDRVLREVLNIRNIPGSAEWN